MQIWLDYDNRRSASYEAQVSALQEIAAAAEVSIAPTPVGTGVSTRLYLLPAKRWQRTSTWQYSEKLGRYHTIHAVCWRGHYRFMSELFKRFPSARVKSASADYRGRDGFIARADATGGKNIGSIMEPMKARDACLCSGCEDHMPYHYDALRDSVRKVEFGTMLPGGRVVSMRVISTAMILACPHVILAQNHYREDSTCRCDDPTHLEMLGWEYKWVAGRWT